MEPLFEFLPEPEQSSSVTPSVLGVHLNKVQTKGPERSSGKSKRVTPSVLEASGALFT